MVETLKWDGQALWVLDQTKLPFTVEYRRCNDSGSVAEAIRSMRVRGAPAIGVTAAFGMFLAARNALETGADLSGAIRNAAEELGKTRPTAVNLFWAIDRMRACSHSGMPKDVLSCMEKTADDIFREDIESCRAIGRHGASLLHDESTVLTHCNAGALATAGYGTALGVIRSAVAAGKKIRVYAGETRPYLQGSRLTVWELMADGIDTTLITDGMAAHFMAKGEIDAVLVGADRIAANGDTANKVGTLSVALAAAAFDIPFYVAAPVSTIDLKISDGSGIPIEERPAHEVTHITGHPVAAQNVKVRNPAFDVTPASHIRAIITDKGIARSPYGSALSRLVNG
ncbi:S-methyl-5-thioribose-1-phosphate isomerase [bacterium]|nr:S-methyl-5-thioribose-1-phosphate isomerase [candidate division CSSED10-310 bacterium]